MSPIDEGPCEEMERLLEEGAVLESGGLGYTYVFDGEDK